MPCVGNNVAFDVHKLQVSVNDILGPALGQLYLSLSVSLSFEREREVRELVALLDEGWG